MAMLQLLKKLLLSAVLVLLISYAPGQEPDGYDTTYTRGGCYVMTPKYDTLKQLEEVNRKVDTLMNDLELIKIALKISNDTVQ